MAKTKHYTILVVDDDEHTREPIALGLKTMGFQVLEASNGEEGWDVFQNNAPDAVITDLRMPGEGGVRLFELIKARKPKLPVFLMTGLIDSLEQNLPADGIFEKPFPFSLLLEALKRALQIAK